MSIAKHLTVLLFSVFLASSLSVSGYAPTAVDSTCAADAGTLTAVADTVPLFGGTAALLAIPDGNRVIPPGYTRIFVLTSGSNLVIEEVNNFPFFTVNNPGDYTIHTLVYDPDTSSADYLDLSVVVFGTTTGGDVLNLVTTNGICASLDVAGAPIHVKAPQCKADAGTLTAVADTVSLNSNGNAILAAVPDFNAFVPFGYSKIYVLTSGPNLVIEQVNNLPVFTVSAPGDYTIHTLVYNDNPNSPNYLDLSVVVFGTTTGGDVLNIVTTNNICASLDVAGAPIHVQGAPCTADAGTLTIDQNPVFLAGPTVTVSATPDGNAVEPAGYNTLFVLTSGSNLVIEQVSSSPSFSVSDTGDYTIHTLIYDPDTASADFLDLSVVVPGVTTGGDVLNIINSTGICASLDVAGAPVEVKPFVCTANAGTLTIDQSPVTLLGTSVTVSATPDGNAVVPTGYNTLFVLTSGANLVIEQVNTSPSFAVSDTGDYTIHTLIYDPDTNSVNYLDLSVVVFGTTTGGDVLNIINSTGICASLDVAGAPVEVKPFVCTADAGTLTAVADTVTISNGTATLAATPDGNAVVPTGYATIFVLTSGPNLVIEQVSASPSFTVNTPGDYTIHTLIYDDDPNSPNYLDLSVVVFGTTTGGDVLNLVTSNGLCADLDVAGAPIHVQQGPCLADAGTLTAKFDTVNLKFKKTIIFAKPDGNAVIPAGYNRIFVLTSGPNLVIEQVRSIPFFFVPDTGLYTIHTLVYDPDPNSPNYLDLSVVVPGTTTGGDVLNIINSNGLCASLDVAGAPIYVKKGKQGWWKKIGLFPNPFKNKVYISGPSGQASDLLVQVTNLQGVVMLSTQINLASGQDVPLDLTGMPEGMYIVRIQDLETGEASQYSILKN